MSKRLFGMIEKLIAEKGKNDAISLLANAVNRNWIVVERWIRSEHVPSAESARRLAKACGCTKAEALELAKEGTAQAKRRTA